MIKTKSMCMLFLLIIIFSPYTSYGDTQTLEKKLNLITLPAGFNISIFAYPVPGARSLAIGDKGIIYVGTRRTGSVYALEDKNGDYKADKIYTIARNLHMPNGVAYRKGDLYVAEVNRIIKFAQIGKSLNNPPKAEIINSSFPEETHHGWKYIAFGPDGYLYIPVGAPCNICLSKDKRFATIMRMKPNGSNLEIFAHGVRNTVGFHWHPYTRELWFTDNGRDWMGNEIPPDELNHAPKKGMHFGYPYCHGKSTQDPKYGKLKKCANFTKPVQNLGAHVAALGMKFYTGKQFPSSYRNQIFIAEHGSWNRFPPFGYRITQVKLKGNRAVSYRVFAQGWLQGIRSWGRPVDILQLKDGSILISDDRAGAVYRISYTGRKR